MSQLLPKRHYDLSAHTFSTRPGSKGREERSALPSLSFVTLGKSIKAFQDKTFQPQPSPGMGRSQREPKGPHVAT